MEGGPEVGYPGVEGSAISRVGSPGLLRRDPGGGEGPAAGFGATARGRRGGGARARTPASDIVGSLVPGSGCGVGGRGVGGVGDDEVRVP